MRLTSLEMDRYGSQGREKPVGKEIHDRASERKACLYPEECFFVSCLKERRKQLQWGSLKGRSCSMAGLQGKAGCLENDRS